jgi:biotin carboxyl carrier protein
MWYGKNAIRIALGTLILWPCLWLTAAPLVTVQQGGVGRWSGLPAKECGIYGKRYDAIEGVCYYPVDIQATAGVYEIAVWDKDGKRHDGSLRVEKASFPDVSMTLPESLERFLHPSPAEQQRSAKEHAEVMKLFVRPLAPAQFKLPLASPASPLPKSEDDFGSLRRFDASTTSLHSGRDFPIPAGRNLRAVADGKVLLVQDEFYSGNAVYVDHGGGLVSMLFHMQKTSVKKGDTVKRGQVLGIVGATGRATGPHLHLGLRWLNKRIDPLVLLNATKQLPDVVDSSTTAQEKIEHAENREPAEKDQPSDE